MKTSQLMNFSIDRENKKISVEREFNASVEKVWQAWTDSKILDQWWAPKPWKARTKSMDFREGGHWLYAMVGPNGEEQFARADYKTIIPLKQFTGDDSFADVNGNVDNSFPVVFWTVNFEGNNLNTKVHIEIAYKDLADLDKYIELGFKEGFTAAFENLDEIFEYK